MCTSWRDLRKMHQSNSRLSSPTHIYVHCVQSASPKVNCKKQVYFWGSAEITPLKFGHNQICSIPRLKDCKLQDWNVHPCLQNSRQIFGSFFISLLKASRWLQYYWSIREINSNNLKITFATWFWQEDHDLNARKWCWWWLWWKEGWWGWRIAMATKKKIIVFTTITSVHCSICSITTHFIPASATSSGPFRVWELNMSSSEYFLLFWKFELFWEQYHCADLIYDLGKESNNQNGNLRWHLPLGVRPHIGPTLAPEAILFESPYRAHSGT